MRQTKLTKAARGRECQVRIPGVCNGNPETTVLAHYRMAGTCGVGIKPNDLQGAWACSACHDACDGRRGDIGRDEARQYHAEGVMRTQSILIREGVLVA
ncbi:DUF1364 domain-containing protein [Pseudomonas taiwanensis]|uniref:DUF1364 domain-containing protein n=1 Tax=Pseudomonas taiwanensis TaxID=470150 RepID=UPI0016491D3C|nr:DUF1364 domain-containing protein [Pseudomonas taiwanensis]MBC3491916.1 DUF1364 domain-containing protein [Pseudomonas taiwanensis]